MSTPATIAAPDQTKACRVCLTEKPLTEFHRKARGQFGVTTICKPCTLEDKRAWRQRNAERNEHLRMGDDPNPDAPKRCPRCGLDLLRRDFYISIGTPDGLQNWCKACLIAQNATSSTNYHARMLGCIGQITVKERDRIYEIQNFHCARCRREIPEGQRCLDHIIPAAPGVLNRPSNLQMLCRSCNMRKLKRSFDYRDPEWLAVWPPD